jgi:shikimate kinase
MRVFLIGMMGSGKTTLGRQLAANLQSPFVDLDEYIEKKEQSTIAELFEKYGPEHFRVLEREALENLVSEDADAVIATGGGTPCFYDNIAFINKHGKSIFLDVTKEEILKRLFASDLYSRPLLTGKSNQELKDFIDKTLVHRRPFYEQATFILSGSEYTVKDLLALLNHK